jgi:hypothetical protein
MFSDAAKEIAGVLHRILFCLQQYFGNSPNTLVTLDILLLASPP